MKEAGLKLELYHDWLDSHGDNETLEEIQRKVLFRLTDAVLRINYYGVRLWSSTVKLSVAVVVEDHTYNLIGDLPMRSTSDWCIASLRKTLPISEGGASVGLKLPDSPKTSEGNEQIATIRRGTMKLKARYLAGEAVEKAEFRKGYVEAEKYFDHAQICALDKASQ